MALTEETGNSSVIATINRTCLLDEQFLTIMMPPILTIFFILAASFNSLALWIFCSHMKKKTPIDILMLNLCMVDLLFTLTYPLVIIYHSNSNYWIFGNFVCKLQTFMMYCTVLASVFFLTCISNYRCYVIIKPIHSQSRVTKKCTIIICVLIWLLAGLFAFPSFYRVNVFELNGKIHCLSFNHPNVETDVLTFTIMLFILTFGIPFISLLVSTLLIQRKLANLTLTAHSEKGRHAIRMMIVILCIFVICFLPINVARLIMSVVSVKSCKNYQQIGVVYYCCVLALYANNVLDPFVYFYAGTKYRSKLINAIKGVAFCNKLPIAASSTQSNTESRV
ncbi:P2Y purinoceptor 4-like [Leucoraja erinacea]|uniref:P2Y purinoceptor 4-like n=1 Tax=Leucoraja erinaceus TaxID=7782 RepID=UPI002457E0CA|nr:P2Y purinoceptor 4-like [Leucoraja erinacea]XP_055513913.1 P2Y purinoceptor 4-like [Leucoraja erinacea]